MSTGYTPIPFPVTRRDSATRRDSEIRRGSVTLAATAVERRGSLTPAASAAVISVVEQREKDRRDSLRLEVTDDNTPTRRVNTFEQDLQRLKIYENRKRPASNIHEDSNGSNHSLYITNRIARVVDDYQRARQEEQKLGQLQVYQNQDQPGFPVFQPQLPQRRPLSASLSTNQRSGSFAQLLNNAPANLGSGPVEQIEWFPRDNAREHRTDRYDVVNNIPPRRAYPVYRRGQNFFMALKLSARNVDLTRNPLLVVFNFGSNPAIGKSTRVALTVTGDREFVQRDKNEWDIR